MVAFLLWGTLALLLLAVIHFGYEAIVLPSLHTALRYRLFALRDRLRRLKYENEEGVDPRVLRYLEQSINGAVRFLPGLDLVSLRAFLKAYKQDKEFRELIRKRVKFLDSCSSDEVQQIRKDLYRIGRDANLANNAVMATILLLALIPIVWVVHNFIKLRNNLSSMLSVSENEMDQILRKAKTLSA